jgi:predicted ATPase
MGPGSNLIGGRYILHEQLGTGSQGAVYRATDRLTGQTVALKRVSALMERLDAAEDELRLILANEFQTLASLHHPHIIGVLDYGFDAQRQPYFTMEYLHDTQTILQAGMGKPVTEQVELLIQVLEVLVYLHRQGVLHRDLKPSNVLVVDGVARVTDFGLSVPRDEARGTVGTFAYLAPEVLVGKPASEPADLYAVGIIAYELLAGHHPFDLTNLSRFINGALNVRPDLAALEVDSALADVIGRLLAKEPHSRYANAEECIAGFSQAVGRALPCESSAIRESFLQAAKFVGRQAELARLTTALDEALGRQEQAALPAAYDAAPVDGPVAAQTGRGSAWLVGGESGVGKSRLLDELRIRALVRGAVALHGQGVLGGGVVYQLWREPLRRLALTVDFSVQEAGILKPVVPDIDALLGCDVPDALELGGQVGQQRLLNTIAGAFLKHRTPTLLILEDLHWARESLDVLRQLVPLVANLPLLIVGSYRDDESPELPDQLPRMRVIKLERLSEREITELSGSMLGEVGRQAEVLALLQRETEGNAFFLVEVVRALAEEAGRLSDIGRVALPARIFPRGIKTIVLRRLERVPTEARSLLHLAAVAGREIDLKLMSRLDGQLKLSNWLTMCANAAVLEFRDGRWRFAHDKLRDGLLSTLDEPERVDAHRRVASAIEEVYPGDPDQAAALAGHWAIVGDTRHERHYARLAGQHAAAQFANTEALAYLSRALDLISADDAGAERAEHFDLLVAREQVHDLLGEREAQSRDLAILAMLAEQLDDGGPRAARRSGQVALRQANYAQAISDYPAAIAAVQRAIEHAGAAGDVALGAGSHLQWGTSLWRLGDFHGCRARLEQALALAQAARSRQLEADSLRALGIVCYYIGDYGRGQAYYELSLPISREIGDRRGEAATLSNLGELARSQGDYAAARGYYGRRLQICRAIGDRQGETIALANLSLVGHTLGDDEAARGYALEMLRITQEIGHRSNQGYALNNLGHALAGLERLAEAADIYRQAVALRHELGEHFLAMESLAGLARVLTAEGKPVEARAAVDEILAYLQTGSLDGTDEPLRIYLTCYHVLKAEKDPRAQEILTTAYELLQQWANRITDEDLRRSLLKNVRAHRQIMDEYLAARSQWHVA